MHLLNTFKSFWGSGSGWSSVHTEYIVIKISFQIETRHGKDELWGGEQIVTSLMNTPCTVNNIALTTTITNFQGLGPSPNDETILQKMNNFIYMRLAYCPYSNIPHELEAGPGIVN